MDIRSAAARTSSHTIGSEHGKQAFYIVLTHLTQGKFQSLTLINKEENFSHSLTNPKLIVADRKRERPTPLSVRLLRVHEIFARLPKLLLMMPPALYMALSSSSSIAAPTQSPFCK
jgi:hypothetical protein